MRARVAATVLCALALDSVAAHAQGSAVPDSAGVDLFITSFVGSLHGRDSLAQSAFVLVRNGKLSVARGFGVAADGRLVSTERTIFRAASNSKLFTTVAVMQLASQGRWKLGDDINRHLPSGVRVRTSFKRAVTIENLLTHTSGFENKLAGAIATLEARPSMAEFFATHMPTQAVEAGEEISYSNIGMGLAGYLVECASGEPFDVYAERHILVPLGMLHSSFRQPPPAEWSSMLAARVPAGARNIAFVPYPAASLITTAEDMGRFIISQLRGGAGTEAILDSQAVALMQAPHWRAQTDVPTVAYGFFEGERNGHRYLYHTGDSGDHSLILLVPDLGIGFYFVFTGSDEQTAVRDMLAAKFLDKFIGPAPVQLPLPREDVSRFAGRYRAASYSRTNFEKAAVLFGEAVVESNGAGELLVWPPGSSAAIRLVRTGAMTFRGDSGEVVAFHPANGKPQRFTLNGLVWDPSSWDRVSWYERSALHLSALVAFAIVVAWRALLAPVWRYRTRRRQARSGTATSTHSGTRKLWRLSGVGALCVLLTPFVFIASLLAGRGNPSASLPVAARNALMMLSTGEVLCVVSCVWLIVVWRQLSGNRLERYTMAMLAGASVIVLPSLVYLRLLYPLAV